MMRVPIAERFKEKTNAKTSQIISLCIVGCCVLLSVLVLFLKGSMGTKLGIICILAFTGLCFLGLTIYSLRSNDKIKEINSYDEIAIYFENKYFYIVTDHTDKIFRENIKRIDVVKKQDPKKMGFYLPDGFLTLTLKDSTKIELSQIKDVEDVKNKIEKYIAIEYIKFIDEEYLPNGDFEIIVPTKLGDKEFEIGIAAFENLDISEENYLKFKNDYTKIFDKVIDGCKKEIVNSLYKDWFDETITFDEVNEKFAGEIVEININGHEFEFIVLDKNEMFDDYDLVCKYNYKTKKITDVDILN